MARIKTIHTIPDELVEQWLLHLRVFDRIHPGCHFEVEAHTDRSMAEIRKTIEKLELPHVVELPFDKKVH